MYLTTVTTGPIIAKKISWRNLLRALGTPKSLNKRHQFQQWLDSESSGRAGERVNVGEIRPLARNYEATPPRVTQKQRLNARDASGLQYRETLAPEGMEGMADLR